MTILKLYNTNEIKRVKPDGVTVRENKCRKLQMSSTYMNDALVSPKVLQHISPNLSLWDKSQMQLHHFNFLKKGIYMTTGVGVLRVAFWTVSMWSKHHWETTPVGDHRERRL